MNLVLDAHLGEQQIRQGLIAYLNRTSVGDTMVRGELPVLASRIDVVRMSARKMEGFEIKSDDDKLSRLPTQAADYNQVFDGLTLVTGRMLAGDALSMTPRFWGILQARLTTDGEVVFFRWQDCAPNPGITASGLASMLWRNEAAECLNRYSTVCVRKSWSGLKIREHLAAHVPRLELRDFVAGRLCDPQRSENYQRLH